MASEAIYNELVLLDPVETALPYWESTMSPALGNLGYRLSNKQATTLHYSRRITPLWTIVVAVLLFPLGLLALLSKQDAPLIVTFDGYGDGTMVKISGNGPKRTKKWLDELTDNLNDIARAAAEDEDAHS